MFENIFIVVVKSILFVFLVNVIVILKKMRLGDSGVFGVFGKMSKLARRANH